MEGVSKYLQILILDGSLLHELARSFRIAQLILLTVQDQERHLHRRQLGVDRLQSTENNSPSFIFIFLYSFDVCVCVCVYVSSGAIFAPLN